MEDLRPVEQVHLAGSSLEERATCGTSSTWALGSHSRIQREGNLEMSGDIGTKDNGLEGYRHKWSAVGWGATEDVATRMRGRGGHWLWEPSEKEVEA